MNAVKNTQYYLDQQMLTAVLIHEDNSTTYLFIQRGMIYVADCDYATLTKLIEDDQHEKFEAYDIIDKAAYFMKSAYAEEIIAALLYLANRLL